MLQTNAVLGHCSSVSNTVGQHSFSHTHRYTIAQQCTLKASAQSHTKRRFWLSACTLTELASAQSAVSSTVSTGTASHLLLSHWHNKRKAARPTKPGRRRGKGRGRGRDSGEKKQKQKETEGSKENCICCRSCQWVVKTWLPSLPTIPFSFFSSFLPPVPETCDISGPLMCTTDR